MKAFGFTSPPSSDAATLRKLGALKQRPAALKRRENELFAELEKFLDGDVSTTEKRKRSRVAFVRCTTGGRAENREAAAERRDLCWLGGKVKYCRN